MNDPKIQEHMKREVDRRTAEVIKELEERSKGDLRGACERWTDDFKRSWINQKPMPPPRGGRGGSCDMEKLRRNYD